MWRHVPIDSFLCMMQRFIIETCASDQTFLSYSDLLAVNRELFRYVVRIEYKLVSLTYKVLTTSLPDCLHNPYLSLFSL